MCDNEPFYDGATSSEEVKSPDNLDPNNLSSIDNQQVQMSKDHQINQVLSQMQSLENTINKYSPAME